MRKREREKKGKRVGRKKERKKVKGVTKLPYLPKICAVHKAYCF